MALPYKFSVYAAGAFNFGSASWAAIVLDTKLYDTGSNVDIVTHKGRFTAAVAGFYHFSAAAATTFASGNNGGVALYKNGSAAKNGSFVAQGAATVTAAFTVSADIQLSAGDYVELYGYSSGGQAGVVGAANTFFDGYLISAT